MERPTLKTEFTPEEQRHAQNVNDATILFGIVFFVVAVAAVAIYRWLF